MVRSLLVLMLTAGSIVLGACGGEEGGDPASAMSIPGWKTDASNRSVALEEFRGLLTFPWVGERAFHRGSGGQSPARLSIARAISALALWKP